MMGYLVGSDGASVWWLVVETGGSIGLRWQLVGHQA